MSAQVVNRYIMIVDTLPSPARLGDTVAVISTQGNTSDLYHCFVAGVWTKIGPPTEAIPTLGTLSVYGAGTAYNLTNTAAAIDLGTTDPALVISAAGTYLVFAKVQLNYNAATFAAVRTVTLKLRRTNNTAADINSVTLSTQITVTLTFTMGIFALPVAIYTTANVNDALSLFADVNTVPSAGSLDAVSAEIIALRIG